MTRVLIAIAAALVLGITMLGHYSPNSPELAGGAGDRFAAARTAVTASLKDPDSARFGPFAGGRAGAICGMVNARNSFGGYTGMEPFVYTADGQLYTYPFHGPLYDWGERGRLAELFAAHGCSVGPDQGQAIAARKALDVSSRRLSAITADITKNHQTD